MTGLDEGVPLSALEHYEYCPRQCALIHVDQIWYDNAHTVRGTAGHRRVDSGAATKTRGVTVLRSIPLWSHRWDLVGRADAVEFHSHGAVVPVEYKVGTRHGIAADIQLCAQAMCLEEMLGVAVPYGFLWLGKPRRRHRVPMTERLRSTTIRRIGAVRALAEHNRLPAPPDDERCEHCQFLGYCMPSLVAHPDIVDRYEAEVVMACEP